jgi:NAD(P)-dependent dehydrogenase (short-subunit alcohol dehydrogenase family)
MNRRQVLQLTGAGLAAAATASCSGPEKIAAVGVPRSEFGADSTAEDVTAGLDLSGRLAVVTGCTSGIGHETMRVLAARGAHVIGTSRSQDRAAVACRSVTGTTTPLALELGNPESIVDCAEQIIAGGQPVDMLICNAGVRGGGNERRLINGIERHFAINHLGHFLFVNRLLDYMFDADQARVVVVASRTSYTDAPDAGIEFDNLDAGRHYDDATAYGQSKLANVLFAYELGKRLGGTRITVNSLHPGLIDTNIDRNLGALTRFAFGILAGAVGKSIEEGAATSCYVATSPLLGAVSGQYFEDCNAVTIVGNPHFGNDELAERLWNVSAELLGAYTVRQTAPLPGGFEGRTERSLPG